MVARGLARNNLQLVFHRNLPLVIEACEECTPGAPKHRAGAPKPFLVNCGRELVPGWDRADPRVKEAAT